jgi:predicted amidophosphoribosyltransferase
VGANDVVLVDNVLVSGATIEGCRTVLGKPDAVGLVYAAESLPA